MKLNFLVWLLPGLVLQACGPGGETHPSGLAPGEMRVLSVESAGLDPAALLLPNGAFDRWYGSQPAPEGFEAPQVPAVTTLLRDVKSGHLNTTGYTARETWHAPGFGLPPEERFHTTVTLEPDTIYALDVVATASEGLQGAVGAYEIDGEGRTRVLTRNVVAVSGADPTRYTGTFKTIAGGPVVLASHLSIAGTLPGTITWSAWNLTGAEESLPPATIADTAPRRALVSQALDQVRGQIALYGGADSWRDASYNIEQNVARILREAEPREGASVLGYEEFVFSKRELAELASPIDATDETKESGAPWRAIVELERVLAARGVHLIVLPVPARLNLYIDRLYRPAAEAPVLLEPHARLLERLLENDVLALDTAPLLRRLRDGGEAVFWRGDLDVPSQTLKALAAEVAPVAAVLLKDAPGAVAADYTEKVDVTPLAQRLVPELMPSQRGQVAGEERRIFSVREGDGGLFTSPAKGPVLAAGSYAAAHQIRGASFAAHLSRELGWGVAIPAKNLSDSEVPAYLASGPAELDGAQLVVFCFPETSLSEGKW